MVSLEIFEPDTATVQAECYNHYALLPLKCTKKFEELKFEESEGVL